MPHGDCSTSSHLDLSVSRGLKPQDTTELHLHSWPTETRQPRLYIATKFQWPVTQRDSPLKASFGWHHSLHLKLSSNLKKYVLFSTGILRSLKNLWIFQGIKFHNTWRQGKLSQVDLVHLKVNRILKIFDCVTYISQAHSALWSL